MKERSMQIQEWFEVYRGELYRHSLFVLGNPQDAEDAVAETFIRVLKFYASFKHDSSPRTWIWSIMRNFLTDLQRQRSRRLTNETAIDLVNVSVGQSFDRLLWEDILNHLNLEQRQIFSLRILQGFNSLETARIMHWSEAHVRVVLHRARRKLQQYVTTNWDAEGLEGQYRG